MKYVQLDNIGLLPKTLSLEYCDVHAVGKRHVLTTVAMATDKHATMDNRATVEAFSL
jgi:hypothetical protein